MTSRRPKSILLLAAALTTAFFAGLTAWNRMAPFPKDSSTTRPDPVETWRQEALNRIRPHYANAFVEARAAADACANEFDQWLASRASQSGALARDLLSWDAKWNLMTSKLPWGDPNAFRKYAEWRFRARIFSAADLTAHAQLTSRELATSLKAIEDKLLVAVRADLDSIPAPACLGSKDDAAFAQAYDNALKAAITNSQLATLEELSNMADGALIQILITAVVERAVAEGLVSAGILSAGALGSAESFGLALVVGIVIDQVITWINNPEAQLSAAIQKEMEKIRSAVMDGDTGRHGLKQQLLITADRWAALHAKALVTYVLAAGSH